MEDGSKAIRADWSVEEKTKKGTLNKEGSGMWQLERLQQEVEGEQKGMEVMKKRRNEWRMGKGKDKRAKGFKEIKRGIEEEIEKKPKGQSS